MLALFGRELWGVTRECLSATCSDDDEGRKSPTLAEKIMSLCRTGEYRDPRSSSSDVQRVDAGVTTIDLELDAPDDVVDVMPEPSGVAVELVDAETLAILSDSTLDRLAAERAVEYPAPVHTQSYIAPDQGSCQPACGATCPQQCSVMMAEVPCDPSPGARCALSLERIGVACPSLCDDEVCPVERPMDEPESAPAAAAQCPVSMTDEVCQTEPNWSSRASSLASGTETEVDFDELYSDEIDDINKVS